MGIKGNKAKLGLILSGQPLIIEDVNIFVTQPKIKDIVLFGEDEFLTTTQMLTNIEQFSNMVKQGNSELNMISDFQLLLIMIEEDFTIKKMVKDLFSLIFPEYKVKITESSIDFFIKDEDSSKIIGRITPFNFENFQITLNDAFIPQVDNEREPDYNPVNDAAQKIADKIKRGRQKVHAQKAVKEGSYSMFADYCSTLSIGMCMDINIFFSYTPFQLYDAYRRFFSKEQSDFYMRVSSMPLMDTSKIETPPEWNRNLY